MSSIINGFIIFSLTVTFAYLIQILIFLTHHEENKCEMTYMFEYPQFVKIYNPADEKQPKYGLYAYSEGRLTEKARNMHFDGIPVLFIPGNAGSYRQVRSLASIALRKALNSRTPYHFDYFTVDLNDELSGLNGALLLEQARYVNHSMYRILELYSSSNVKNRPRSVVLVGHSMGGVIARRIQTKLSDDSDLIPIVLTLASPHKRPPLMLDQFIHDFYNKINDSKHSATFVSLSGGHRDVLVPSFLTSVDDSSDSLSVVTSEIPRSWLLADHLCILWCKQTILAINRALFDCVDPKTKQITLDSNLRKAVFYHHLVEHSGTKVQLRDSYAIKAAVSNNGEWVEQYGRQYSVHLAQGVSKTHFYMVRLLNHLQHEALTVLAINQKTVDWAFVCGAHLPRGNSRVCEEFAHLTQHSRIIPSAQHKRRMLTVNMHELMRSDPTLSHVVIRVLPTSEPVVLNFDVYNVAERRRVVTLPNLLSFRKQVVVAETPEKAVFFELELPQLAHLIQSYQLFVDSIGCVNEMRHASATLSVPWGHQDQHKFFIHNDTGPLHVRLYESKPQGAASKSATVRLTLDPNCRYKISIQPSLMGAANQMARYYTPLLPANMAAVILMALNSQLRTIGKDNTCSLFFTAVQDGAKPYYILTAVKLISRVLSAKQFVAILPPPDWSIMAQEGTDFFFLPLLLYVCGVGLVWMLGIVLCGSLFVFEATVHKLALKFLAKTVSFTVSWSDYVMSALHKVPSIVAAALISLSLTTSGSVALCVGMVFYFLRLTQLSQDYVEEMVWFYVKKIGRKFKKGKNKDNGGGDDSDGAGALPDAIFFHTTLFMLWTLTTAINIPSALTWAHNFKYSTFLHPDPSFVPGLVLSICALPLWQLDLPKKQRGSYVEMANFVAVLAVGSLIFAQISLFRLNYTLTMAIVGVTLHQLLGPTRDVTSQQGEGIPGYDGIKTKME